MALRAMQNKAKDEKSVMRQKGQAEMRNVDHQAKSS
jgi:hypothetical protein